LHTSEYPTPAARPHYSVLDKTKIKQTYGIEIPYWEESLKECIELLCVKFRACSPEHL
jgi:dTDP-4-dehydrorhamnose reductase